MSYRAIPNALYTNPEVASVGLSEADAEQAGHTVSVGRFPYRASGKAVAYGEREGLAKVVAEKRRGVLLGVSVFGVHATDLIAEATLAIEHQMTAEELAEAVHAHPTLSEIVMEAAEDALGRAIHK
jgi:dihydrolipoamide dehydrogenase